jgi:hypothetical protein
MKKPPRGGFCKNIFNFFSAVVFSQFPSPITVLSGPTRRPLNQVPDYRVTLTHLSPPRYKSPEGLCLLCCQCLKLISNELPRPVILWETDQIRQPLNRVTVNLPRVQVLKRLSVSVRNVLLD